MIDKQHIFIHATSFLEAQKYSNEGYCPIECSFGSNGSVVDSLFMDHHGELSHLESVAIRAYRDHYGIRRSDPRFVVTGMADADATFAIAALLGIIPHPERNELWARQDITYLAELIAHIDIDPIGFDLPNAPGGDVLLLWNALTHGNRGSLGFAAGVCLWGNLTNGEPPKALLEAAKIEESTRREKASTVHKDMIGNICVVTDSPVWGFDIWYGRRRGKSSLLPEGWDAPIVVAFNEKTQGITIGCPNLSVAEKLFGAGGLKNIFPYLGAGWGGRETIGGSPRGEVMFIQNTYDAAKIIANCGNGLL